MLQIVLAAAEHLERQELSLQRRIIVWLLPVGATLIQTSIFLCAEPLDEYNTNKFERWSGSKFILQLLRVESNIWSYISGLNWRRSNDQSRIYLY